MLVSPSNTSLPIGVRQNRPNTAAAVGSPPCLPPSATLCHMHPTPGPLQPAHRPPSTSSQERNVPNRIVGYSGHRPGNNDSVGQCVNIEYFAEQSMEGYVPPPAADSTTMNSSNIYRLG